LQNSAVGKEKGRGREIRARDGGDRIDAPTPKKRNALHHLTTVERGKTKQRDAVAYGEKDRTC